MVACQVCFLVNYILQLAFIYKPRLNFIHIGLISITAHSAVKVLLYITFYTNFIHLTMNRLFP